MRASLYDYCAERNKLALLAQWHPVKNGPLTPRQVSYGSRQKIWWLCPKGHEWQAAVYTRTKGSGCPYCSGKTALSGFNDLATLAPEVADQWRPTLNGTLTPDQVTAGSHRTAWWACSNGHIWKAIIYSRAGPQKCGCPVCAGKVRPERQECCRRMLAEMEERAGQPIPGRKIICRRNER